MRVRFHSEAEQSNRAGEGENNRCNDDKAPMPIVEYGYFFKHSLQLHIVWIGLIILYMLVCTIYKNYDRCIIQDETNVETSINGYTYTIRESISCFDTSVYCNYIRAVSRLKNCYFVNPYNSCHNWI